MAEKKINLDTETGRIAPKSADKSKTTAVRINHPFIQIVDDVRKGKNERARNKFKRLGEADKETFTNLLGEVLLLIESEG